MKGFAEINTKLLLFLQNVKEAMKDFSLTTFSMTYFYEKREQIKCRSVFSLAPWSYMSFNKWIKMSIKLWRLLFLSIYFRLRSGHWIAVEQAALLMCAYLSGGKPSVKLFALEKVPQMNCAVGTAASVAHNRINFSVVFEDALLQRNMLHSMWSIHSSVNENVRELWDSSFWCVYITTAAVVSAF